MRNYWDEIKKKIAIASKDRLRSKFANTAKVQPNTVKAWVEGGTVPGIDKLGPIAEALGCQPWELIPAPDVQEAPPKEPGNAELLKALEKLQQEIRELKAQLAKLSGGNAPKPTKEETQAAIDRIAADAKAIRERNEEKKKADS